MIKHDDAVHVLHSLTGRAVENPERRVREEAPQPESGLKHGSIESLLDQLKAEGHAIPTDETEEVSWRGLLNTSKGD